MRGFVLNPAEVPPDGLPIEKALVLTSIADGRKEAGQLISRGMVRVDGAVVGTDFRVFRDSVVLLEVAGMPPLRLSVPPSPLSTVGGADSPGASGIS